MHIVACMYVYIYSVYINVVIIYVHIHTSRFSQSAMCVVLLTIVHCCEP